MTIEICQSPKVFPLPSTEAGREALRDHLYIVRNCGPAPLGYHFADVNWDEVGEALAELPASYWSEAR